MPKARATPGQRAEGIVAVAAWLGDTPDLAGTLQGIAATARTALGADRATCYVHDPGSYAVSAVYTTEEDPRRRAYLDRAIGSGTRDLPILQLQLSQDDPLLVIEDTASSPHLPPALADHLGSGAFIGLRLEHASVSGDGSPILLGTLFISYS